MSLSLRNIALNCLGITPPFPVLRGVFGYFRRPGQSLSLRQQLERIKGPCININLILVGVENFTNDDYTKIYYAVQFTRDAYHPIGLGIRKIHWQQISVADAGGYTYIGSAAEAVNLTDDWNGASGALDVFYVRSAYTYGVSAVDGPCSKDDKDEMTGSVVSLNCCSVCNTGITCSDDIGTTLAHEIGHYLGLDHDNSTQNLMGNSNGNVDPGTSALTSSQGNKMRNHCYVKDIC